MNEAVVLTQDEAAEMWYELRTISYGYAKPFYWIRYPDGSVERMITKGKLLASMAVLRMNYPYITLKLEGKLPEKKGRRHGTTR